MANNLCIIVPHFGSDEDLINFVNRYKSLKSNIPLILGINNLVSDNLHNFLFAQNNVFFDYVEKKGSYSARNYIIRKYYEKFSIFAFTDSDCILTESYFEALSQLEDSQNQIIAGKIRIVKPDATYSQSIYLYEKLFELNQSEFETKKKGVTANLVISKKIFENQGLFNEDLYSGGDNEFCNIAETNCCEFIYNEELLVLHPARRSYGDLINKNTRVFGGWYTRYSWHKLPFLLRILTIFYSMRPPINRLKMIFLSPNSLYDKIRIIKVLFFVRLVRLLFHFKLIIRFEPCR